MANVIKSNISKVNSGSSQRGNEYEGHVSEVPSFGKLSADDVETNSKSVHNYPSEHAWGRVERGDPDSLMTGSGRIEKGRSEHKFSHKELIFEKS